MLQDAHIHIQDAGDERLTGAFIAEAEQKGISRFFCNSSLLVDWQRVAELSRRYSCVVPFFGVHPWEAEKIIPGWEESLLRACAVPASGIGEIGLDKSRKDIDFEKQKDVFSRQVDIACSLRRPFSVHCVRAWDVLIDILRGKDLTRSRFMIHAFSGTGSDLRALLDLGAFISFRTLKSATVDKLALLKLIPLDRLFLETDFPDMAGIQKGITPSSEYYVQYLHGLYSEAAVVRGEPENTFMKGLWDNGTVFMR
ncbi:MAG: TatD family hydrolase [Candidatus Omnitrophica bacterium]|nr:TatD family hydrolase [Candidatus Omnitrophota bacterium]